MIFSPVEIEETVNNIFQNLINILMVMKRLQTLLPFVRKLKSTFNNPIIRGANIAYYAAFWIWTSMING